MASLHRLVPVDTIAISCSNLVYCSSRLAQHSSLSSPFLGKPELLSFKALCMAASASYSFPFRSKLSLCRALSNELPHFNIPAADTCLFSRQIDTFRTGSFLPGSQGSPRKEALAAVGKQVSLDVQQSIVYSELQESMWKFEAPPRFLRQSDSEFLPCLGKTATYIRTHIHDSSVPVKNPNLYMDSSTVDAKGRPLSLHMLKRKLSQVPPRADCMTNPCRCRDGSKQRKQSCPPWGESMHSGKPKTFLDECDSFSSAFVSLFSMLKMLQQNAHVLRIRSQPSIFEPDRGCYERLVDRACTEMLDSFLWIFQQVFSCTPELMLLTMVLLADFTLHSMSMHLAFSVLSLGEPSSQQHGLLAHKESAAPGKKGEELSHAGHRAAHHKFGRSVRKAYGRCVAENPHASLSLLLPSSLSHHDVLEKLRMFGGSFERRIASNVPMKLLVAPVRVPALEADDYPCFDRTDLAYQHEISRDPRNPLLLANYAHFLHLVRHDYGRAEQLYKRAINVEEEVNGDVMGRFASFLWVAKGDVAEAEKAFKAATVADPANAYHAGNYAHFLWNTSTGQA